MHPPNVQRTIIQDNTTPTPRVETEPNQRVEEAPTVNIIDTIPAPRVTTEPNITAMTNKGPIETEIAEAIKQRTHNETTLVQQQSCNTVPAINKIHRRPHNVSEPTFFT